MTNYVKKYRRHEDEMNVARGLKLPNLILSFLWLSSTDIGLNFFVSM